MSENKQKSRALPLLLMLCAGALLVIVLSLAGEVYDAQLAKSAYATQMADGVCGMPEKQLNMLSPGAQMGLQDQCNLKPDAETDIGIR